MTGQEAGGGRTRIYQFTCFLSTKVQILTAEEPARQEAGGECTCVTITTALLEFFY